MRLALGLYSKFLLDHVPHLRFHNFLVLTSKLTIKYLVLDDFSRFLSACHVIRYVSETSSPCMTCLLAFGQLYHHKNSDITVTTSSNAFSTVIFSTSTSSKLLGPCF